MLDYDFSYELVHYGKYLGIVFEKIHLVDASVVISKDNVVKLAR